MQLRRTYQRHVGHQHRFFIAALVTIVVVAYVVVPWVAALLEGLATYTPGYYEPKDFARGEAQRRAAPPSAWTSETLIGVGLFVLLAVVWFISVSDGGPRGRSR